MLRNRLAQQLNLPRQYPNFIRIVQQLAGRSSSSVQQPHASSSGNGNGNGHHYTEPMDLNVVTLNTIDSTPRARSVSPELRQQYRADGRCVRCGSHGHWVQDCLLEPFSPRIKQLLANLDTPALIAYPKPKAGKVTIAAIDNKAYDDDAAYNSSDDWPQYEVKQSDLD